MIGIVGGIGPLAGIDLYKRIIEQTAAGSDQEHLPVLLASLSAEIPDRTRFLRGEHPNNPAEGIARVIALLEHAGASHIGIACNTVHASPIFDRLLEILQQNHSKAELLHLIDLTVQTILAHPDGVKRIGLMVTAGAYQTGIYQTYLQKAGLQPVLLPPEQHNEWIHTSIYAIKQEGQQLSRPYIDRLNRAAAELQELGAQGIILGCTEIGMVEDLLEFGGMTVFNPNTILARALVAKIAPEKLKPQPEWAGMPV